MSIMPPTSPEQYALSGERLILMYMQEWLSKQPSMVERHERGFRHLKEVFDDAARTDDITGRRKRFVKWFGEDDATTIITSFNSFLTSYWDRSVAAKGFVPFDEFFDLVEVPKEEVLSIIGRLLEKMNEWHEGFALWPPPRRGPCF